MSNTIIKRGETFRRSLKLTYAETGVKVDLSGCVVYSQMRTSPGGMLIATAACTIQRDTGTIYVMWNSEQTQAMSPGKYGYDVWVVYENERKPIYTELVEVVDRYTDNFQVVTEPEPEPEPQQPEPEPEPEQEPDPEEVSNGD